jgi:hypothetical protein
MTDTVIHVPVDDVAAAHTAYSWAVRQMPDAVGRRLADMSDDALTLARNGAADLIGLIDAERERRGCGRD